MVVLYYRSYHDGGAGALMGMAALLRDKEEPVHQDHLMGLMVKHIGPMLGLIIFTIIILTQVGGDGAEELPLGPLIDMGHARHGGKGDHIGVIVPSCGLHLDIQPWGTARQPETLFKVGYHDCFMCR